MRGAENPSDVLSREGALYFEEEPLESLYSDQHRGIMKYILEAMNEREKGKPEKHQKEPNIQEAINTIEIMSSGDVREQIQQVLNDRHNNKQTVIEEWNANQEWFMNIEDEDEEQEEDKKEEETIAPEITVQEYDYEYNEGMDDLDEKHGGDDEEVDEKTTKTTEEKDKELKEEQEYRKRITLEKRKHLSN